ncbi:tetratricopeptide repeat protein [Roseixanthobacter liquoris]|uniref:tetratricopeptide repeat protein n=1 Tax=Roseixanthobacter liquoris TaxID=3119921 RepID=UPI003729BC11
MRPFRGIAPALILLPLCVALSACGANGGDSLSSWGNTLPAMEVPTQVEAYPDNQVLQVAKNQFRAGNYGRAVRYYERAVEVAPESGEAWLGLAASYDRVRRFDLADRAYRMAGQYLGDRAEYYNNVGYSYMLRGDLAKARDNFLKALSLDPSNVTAANNLQMLRSAANRKPG